MVVQDVQRRDRLLDRIAVDSVEPAASPRLQEALVLESQGRYEEAADAASAATEREPTSGSLSLCRRRDIQRKTAKQKLLHYDSQSRWWRNLGIRDGNSRIIGPGIPRS